MIKFYRNNSKKTKEIRLKMKADDFLKQNFC